VQYKILCFAQAKLSAYAMQLFQSFIAHKASADRRHAEHYSTDHYCSKLAYTIVF